MTDLEGREAILMLWAAPSLLKEEFGRKFAIAAKATRPPEEEPQHWALLLDRQFAAPLPHDIVMSDSPPPCDATIQIFPSKHGVDLTTVARRELDRLVPIIDRDRTKAVICTQVVIVPGEAPVFVMMANQRPERITHEEHIEAWYGRHAKLGVATGVARYRQHHVRVEETAEFAKGLGLSTPNYDGIACSYFSDLAEGLERMSGTYIGQHMIDDETSFIDHSKSSFGLYQMVSDH